MSKMMLNKIRLVLVAVLVTMVIGMAGMFVTAKADVNYTSISDVTLAMDGADVIVEGENGVNGLMFTVSMSVAEYEAMIGAEGSVNTGLIIAPAYYNDEVEINKDSLFGDEATYDWAEYVNNEWVYSGNKIRVININVNDWVNAGDKYIYTGAIVDILPQNETEVMMAIGYVNVGDEYNFSPIGKSSVVEAALKANLDETQQAWVDANWLDVIPVADEEVNLVSVAGKTEVNLLDCVSDEAKDVLGAFSDATVSAVDANGNVLDSAIVDVTNENNLRAWTVEVKVGTTVVYTGVIDLYNMTSKLVWNTISEDSLNSFIAYYPSSTTLAKLPTVEKAISSVGDKATIAITDLKNWAGNAPGEGFFTMMPVHTKGYYELYQGKDVTMNLGMYFETDITPDEGKYIVNQGAVGYNNGIISAPAVNTWHNATLELDTLIANWDVLVNGNGTYGWDFRDDLAMFYALMSDYKPSEDLVYHFTGFELAMDVSALAVKGGDILVKLDDVADKTALDLTSYMKKGDADMIKSVASINTLTYEMKGYSVADTITVTDLSSVDVSTVAPAAYVLNVKSGDSIIYNATFDLYNSTDAVVWANELTSYNVVTRTAAFNIGAYYTESVKATGTASYEIVDTFTEGSVTGNGSFAKFTINEAMLLAFDIKPLHTKTYYNETIGDTSKVLLLRTWVSSAAGGHGVQVLCGHTNYGIHNEYKVKGRFGLTGGAMNNLALSLDNNFLATSAADVYHNYYYDYWQTIEGDYIGNCRPMVTFEVTDAQIDATNGFVCYVGFQGNHIVDGGETLATAPAVSTIDLSTETSYDLINLIPANQQAKFKAMAKAWIGKSVSCCGTVINGNGLGFVLTINGETHVVAPDADGKAMLNLDDYIVSANGTVSDTYKVRDLLDAGNNSATVIGRAVSANFIGHSVVMLKSSSITIVGPAA